MRFAVGGPVHLYRAVDVGVPTGHQADDLWYHTKRRVSGRDTDTQGRTDQGSENGLYPVHFQQHARFPLRIPEVGVGQAGAEAQHVPLEATGFLCLFLGVVLHKVLSFVTLPVVLLLRIVISCQAEMGISEEWGGVTTAQHVLEPPYFAGNSPVS